MRRLKCVLYSIFVGTLSVSALLAQARDVRELVDRVVSDLRRAEDIERSKGKELTRYENALRHLSDFDKDLTKGHFEKGKLDTAIDDVKNIVDHNTLDPENRDAITNDLRDLRLARSDHDHN